MPWVLTTISTVPSVLASIAARHLPYTIATSFDTNFTRHTHRPTVTKISYRFQILYYHTQFGKPETKR